MVRHLQLVDYEEDEVLAPELAKTTEDAPAAGGEGAATDGGDKDKKGSYVGIHSTGFRYVAFFLFAGQRSWCRCAAVSRCFLI